MSELFDRLLEVRGFSRGFLRPKYEEAVDPFLLPDREKAAERIQQVINRGEKVLIYGDYDVDGVTASTVLYDALTMAGAKEVTPPMMIPEMHKKNITLVMLK